MSQNTTSVRITSVINDIFGSATDADNNTALYIFFYIQENCAAQQVLKAGTWSSLMMFSAFYLKHHPHRYMDALSSAWLW